MSRSPRLYVVAGTQSAAAAPRARGEESVGGKGRAHARGCERKRAWDGILSYNWVICWGYTGVQAQVAEQCRRGNKLKPLWRDGR